MHRNDLFKCLALVALSLSNAACSGDGAVPPRAATAGGPNASADAPAASASNAQAVAAGIEQACPPEPRGKPREGAAVLNASPDDLPSQVLPAGKEPPPRPKLKFDDARGGAPKAPSAAFAIWYDDQKWHLHATGKGAKPKALHQARVSAVSDVAAEEAGGTLRVINRPRLSPGRCWNDPPNTDPAHAMGGFDLAWDGTARGISFKVPDQACFTVTLRVASKQELPAVQIGEKGKPPKAEKGQDTFELCP